MERIHKHLAQATFEEKLNTLFDRSQKLKTPIAIWRNPADHVVHVVVQTDKSNQVIEEIESAPLGFIFRPFETLKPDQNVFIKGDLYITSIDKEIAVDPTVSDHQVDRFLNAEIQHDHHPAKPRLPKVKLPDDAENKQGYEALVSRCIQTIQEGTYQKIVPSRYKVVHLKNDFDPIIEFFKLSNAYTNAFISLVSTPNHGMWLGATPELLLSVEDRKKFTTVSLAGTQVIGKDFPLAKAAWTQKEIEEQAMVSRYIINCFKKIRLREFEEYGPKTVRAGNLAHLKTTFEVDMESVNFPQLGTVMLELLHPTSAVCGMPMKSAFEFLKEFEGYNRSYYSGYLGPTNVDNDTSLYVNLRCMQIEGKQATLYAGAGITEDSEPESEWNETEMKMRTLLNIIQ